MTFDNSDTRYRALDGPGGDEPPVEMSSTEWRWLRPGFIASGVT